MRICRQFYRSPYCGLLDGATVQTRWQICLEMVSAAFTLTTDFPAWPENVTTAATRWRPSQSEQGGCLIRYTKIMLLESTSSASTPASVTTSTNCPPIMTETSAPFSLAVTETTSSSEP